MNYSTKVKNTTTVNEGVIMRTQVEELQGEVKVHVSVHAKHNDTDRLDLWLSKSELEQILKAHFPKTFERAEKWNALDSQIYKFYFDDEGEELPEDEGGDLFDIGEIAAAALGYL